MSRKTIITLTIVLLLLLNTAVLGMLWWNKADEKPMPGGGAKDFLRKELAFTPEQDEKFEDLRKEHFQAMQRLNRETRELKESVFEKIPTATEDSVEIEKIIRQIAENEYQKDMTTVKHFSRVRSILTVEQKQKFDKVIMKVMRMMGRPPHRGMHPPDGPQGPPPDGMPPHPPPPGGPGEELPPQ